MKAKWYISTFFLLFIFLGAFQEQVSIPNQEIILEFIDTKINQNDVKNTIAKVKQKLLKVGVSNISITKTNNGNLKISYYSLVDVDHIKNELANKHPLAFNKNADHKEKDKNSSNYSFSIHKITNETDLSNSDFKFVFDTNNHLDRSTTFIYDVLAKKTEEHKANQLFTTSYRVHKSNPFIKNRTSFKATEVRAGPKRIFI